MVGTHPDPHRWRPLWKTFRSQAPREKPMPNSQWQVGRYHQKGLAAKQDRRLQSSQENFGDYLLDTGIFP
jgi:hypothetical protein